MGQQHGFAPLTFQSNPLQHQFTNRTSPQQTFLQGKAPFQNQSVVAQWQQPASFCVIGGIQLPIATYVRVYGALQQLNTDQLAYMKTQAMTFLASCSSWKEGLDPIYLNLGLLGPNQQVPSEAVAKIIESSVSLSYSGPPSSLQCHCELLPLSI